MFIETIRLHNDKQRLEDLLKNDDWTLEEKQWLLTYLENSDSAHLHDLMKQWHQAELFSETSIDNHFSKLMRQHIGQHTGIDMKAPITQVQVLNKSSPFRWLAAACIMFVLATIAYHLINNQKVQVLSVSKTSAPAISAYQNDVLPGREKAMLTLADGSFINLDSVFDGALAIQGNTNIIKLKKGQLTYRSGEASATTVLYNILSTPRGGQYKLTLPDGTDVWLNASSSIRFPTEFVGKDRSIEITGEVYFEVAKNPSMPFKVKLPDGNEIEVLGTHFNIYSYPDGTGLRTTLLEGSVKFLNGNNTITLKPGEQALLNNQDELTVIEYADLNEAMAWKNGLFHFKSTGIKNIMLQLSRWYDVDVVYENEGSNQRFNAKIPRNTPVSNVLRLLELTGEIGFKIEGKKIIVTN